MMKNPFNDLSSEDLEALVIELTGIQELEIGGLRYMSHDTKSGVCFICRSFDSGCEGMEGIGDTLKDATVDILKQIINKNK